MLQVAVWSCDKPTSSREAHQVSVW